MLTEPGVAVDGSVPVTLASNFVPVDVELSDETTIKGGAVAKVGLPVNCATAASQ